MSYGGYFFKKDGFQELRTPSHHCLCDRPWCVHLSLPFLLDYLVKWYYSHVLLVNSTLLRSPLFLFNCHSHIIPYPPLPANSILSLTLSPPFRPLWLARLTADDVIVDASSSYTPSPLITSQIIGSICLNSYVDSGNIYVSYSFCVFYIGLHMVSGFPSPFCHVYFSFCFYLSLYIISEFFGLVERLYGWLVAVRRGSTVESAHIWVEKFWLRFNPLCRGLNSFMPIRTHWISSVHKCKSKVLSVMEEPLDNAVTLFVAQCSSCSCRCYI